MIGCSVGVDDVKDSLASDDKAMAKALAFRGDFARFELWVLTFVVASEVTDDVRVLRLGKDEVGSVVRFELLQTEYEM